MRTGRTARPCEAGRWASWSTRDPRSRRLVVLSKFYSWLSASDGWSNIHFQESSPKSWAAPPS